MSRRRGKVCKQRKLNIRTLTLEYKRSKRKVINEYNYMDVTLDFGEELGYRGIPVDSSMFVNIIENSLKLLFGEVGASIVFDVVKYREKNRRAILRFYERDLVKLWSSLTMCSEVGGKVCAFRVNKVSQSMADESLRYFQ
ncbi:ribonuclease P protein subunit p14-like [Limulus polyphemus]|uniref:Ribonuclease P protein subunit p14-like n=1 Tax=Limulus polyphemus TaxID=6850 RepID=A0ABM1BQE4_LIMPO|nr:ribonuclease P protein subunit p14-like [Limulus polyphemus]